MERLQILLELLTCLAIALVAVWWRTRRPTPELPHDAPRPKVRLAVVQPAAKTCASCAHFDLVTGQRELQAHAPFWAAAQSVPPWRMGRVLKVDGDGNALPLEEQGIDPAMLKVTWEQAGLCGAHREMRFSPQPACERYTAPANTTLDGAA